MVWRRIAIKEDKAVEEAVKGTDSFFLPTGHPIANMMLTVRAKNESDHNAPNAVEAETVIKALSEIKVEAGSRVFKQYSAEIAMGWATYRNGRENYCNLTQALGGSYPAGWQEIAIPIDFGRFPDDRVCGLPAPLYKDGGLKMSLTYNFPVDDAGSQNAFLTGAANHRYDLYANIMPHMHENSLRAMKVLTQTKKRTYTTKASGTDLISMSIDPSGAKHARQYLVYAYKTAIKEAALLSEIEVVLNGKETIMSDRWRGWQRLNAEDCDLEFQRRVETKAQTTDDQYHCKIPDVQPFFTAGTTTSEDVAVTHTADQVTMATQTADDAGMLFLNSPVVPCCAVIDFDRDLKLQNLLSLKQKKIQLRIENVGSGGAAEFHEMLLEPAVL